MTPYASVALFRREGELVSKAPRKERPGNVSHARKAASRFWNGSIAAPDQLTKIVLVQCTGKTINVAERERCAARAEAWLEYDIEPAEALKQPHLAACLHELGIDPANAPPPMPDTLEINGVTYRREI